jgi:hypothetical protein
VDGQFNTCAEWKWIHSFVDTIVRYYFAFYGMRQAAQRLILSIQFGCMVANFIFGASSLHSWSLLSGGRIDLSLTHIQSSLSRSGFDPVVVYIDAGASLPYLKVLVFASLRQFNAEKGSRDSMQAFRHNKDPPMFMVLFEDGVSRCAFLLIGALPPPFRQPVYDGVASIFNWPPGAGGAAAVVLLTRSREVKSADWWKRCGQQAGGRLDYAYCGRNKRAVSQTRWCTPTGTACAGSDSRGAEP